MEGQDTPVKLPVYMYEQVKRIQECLPERTPLRHLYLKLYEAANGQQAWVDFSKETKRQQRMVFCTAEQWQQIERAGREHGLSAGRYFMRCMAWSIANVYNFHPKEPIQ